jgi:uncharacterized Zn-binding protein involved in type VI secretion
MGMMAAKHTDLVVGMDMHMIQPPAPAPPVMVPHPVAGMIMDPADYNPGACTVFINGLPRARAGTMCMMSPPHVPIGGMFVKPPLSEAEVYQGSSTVTADGEAMSAMSHQVLGCHDIGAPAPVRKWKSGGAKSLMKAGSVVIAIPAGSPVMIGGAPTTSASGETVGDIESDPPERTATFTITFMRNGLERRSIACEVSVDGAIYGDVTATDVRGRVSITVPMDAGELAVTFAKGLPSEEVHTYKLFQLDEGDTPLGAKQRLANLGYLKGPANDAMDDVTKAALSVFQAQQGLEPTGELDEATWRSIVSAHGS